MNKSIKRISCIILCLSVIFAFACSFSFAASPTDEILSYIILADLNDDGTVNLKYSLDWKVLESDGIGPLEDVYVGIPNSRYVDYWPVSDNIDYISYDSYSGCMHIIFNDSYYEGEVASFEFEVVQDYMYEMNSIEDGYTLYYFVPGWFDEIAVDYLAICWKAENAAYYSSGSRTYEGYLVWETSLSAGESYQVEISYPNDCGYFFDETKSYKDPYSGGGNEYYYDDDDSGSAVLGFIILIIIVTVVKKIKNAASYDRNSGFASGATKTKVTRTKIEYYPNCPGCGAQRKEGQTTCEYCGRSLIKSEEVLKEEEVPDEDKEALKYKKSGEYRYSSSPNTYVRVNVVHVPVSSSSSHSSSSSSSRRSSSSSSHRSSSSCVHSSCACACASCACACACACAGGGRAGCSNKDFYNTKLKLKQLEMKKH